MHEDIWQRLVTSHTLLVGFWENKVLGEISLLVTLGEGRFEQIESLTFLVVRSPSRYNVIVGRLGLCVLFSIVSTSHIMMKIPTKADINTHTTRS